MTRQEARDWIDASNRIFAVDFVKRSTGERRVMNCRRKCLCHLKDGPAAYCPDERGLIVVFDMRNGYRSIPLEGITRIKIDGKWEDVQ